MWYSICLMVLMQADEAYCIGPAASSESYLRGDKIVRLAKSVGAQVNKEEVVRQGKGQGVAQL